MVAPLTLRPFAESVPMALLRAREATMRRFRPLLAEFDLTEQQWRVLRALASIDDALPVGEVAERTLLLGPSLSRILVNLEGRGLIARTTAVHDQRRANIALSRRGRVLVRRIAPRSEVIYREIEVQFGPARLHDLLSELHDLAQSLAAAEGERSTREPSTRGATCR